MMVTCRPTDARVKQTQIAKAVEFVRRTPGHCASGSMTPTSLAYRNKARGCYAAMPCLGTTVTVQRMGLLDLISITERTIPVTGIPFNITVAFWPRYWAKRQRRASIGSVISIGCMHPHGTRNSSATICTI
jgi:hypothetical protein